MPEMDDFLDRLASGDPVPGGGSVAALQVAMGASLLAMVCELTKGREKFASVQDAIEEIGQQAIEIGRRARGLVEADAAAFRQVSEAMRLPRSTDEEKASRRQAIQAALKGAVGPPLETMRQAARGTSLALRLTPIGNPSAISDAGTAALSLAVGFHAAKLNVEINLASIKDEAFVKQVQAAMPPPSDIDEACKKVMQIVEREIGASA